MGTADQTLAHVTRAEWDNYLRDFGATEEALVASLSDASLIDKARSSAPKQNILAAEAQSRSLGRRGVQMTGAQAAALQRNSALSNALNNATALNNARVDQRERNLSLGSTVMQLGRGVNSTALEGMGTAASLESSRNAQNAAAKAQSKANTLGTIGSIAQTAAMLYMM